MGPDEPAAESLAEDVAPLPVDAERRAMLDELLAMAHIAVLQISPDGRIAGWNSGAESLFGFREAEVIGEPLDLVFHQDEFHASEGQVSWTVSSKKRDGGELEIQIFALPETRETAGRSFLINDITEKKFLERALLEAAEREQRRIGQDLHDHLCQHLLGAAFAAKAQAGALERENSPHAPELHDLARLINDAVSQVRDISRGLHPVEMDEAGLMSALHELAHRVNSSIPCTFRCDRKVLVKDAHQALQAYRIAQEAVANALQRTRPTHILISLSERDKLTRLEVTDDGSQEGELTADSHGTVAKTLQYRAQAMNGSVTLAFRQGVGTKVACTFPQSS